MHWKKCALAHITHTHTSRIIIFIAINTHRVACVCPKQDDGHDDNEINIKKNFTIKSNNEPNEDAFATLIQFIHP